jgi:dipeptidase D
MQHSEATQSVMRIFHELSKVPRRSKEEEKIAQFLYDWAKERGFEVVKDSANNIIIKVDASPGYEDAPIIVLQSHMDMVCEKTPESTHDFTKDPIEIIEKDGWIYANGTTLGADDGLGVALSLAVAIDEKAPHPALELLITSDEETGMTGALALSSSAIKGRILLNLDSEDEGVFTIGCAGGRGTKATLMLYSSAVPKAWKRYKIDVTGLTGGHSGVDIHLGRANAMKLAARLLRAISVEYPEILLQDFSAGSAHNAIPRDAHISLVGPESAASGIQKIVTAQKNIYRAEFEKTDPDINIIVNSEDNDADAYDRSSSERVIDLLLAYPHGVSNMSSASPELVETSVNLARAAIEDGKLKLISSQRSSVTSRLDALTAQAEACIRLSGGVAVSDKGYPSWQPNWDSELLKRSIAAYEARFGKEPKIEVIHAGLECGYLGAKFRDMDMISFGPTILSPHSPTERAELATIGMVYDFLCDLLASYKP